METGNIDAVRESGPELNSFEEHREEGRRKHHLGYTSRIFPVNALVKIAGRTGLYRIVSSPYIPAGYSFPHFDVEASGERFRANVFTATRILPG